jgi:hypothetical protein
MSTFTSRRVEAPPQPIRRRGRKVARSALVGLPCVVMTLSAADAEERRLQRERVDVVVWTPDGRAAARWPVVVFSHGIHMCANQSRFITQAMAAAGYLVIAPNHADANCSFNRGVGDEPPRSRRARQRTTPTTAIARATCAQRSMRLPPIRNSVVVPICRAWRSPVIRSAAIPREWEAR